VILPEGASSLCVKVDTGCVTPFTTASEAPSNSMGVGPPSPLLDPDVSTSQSGIEGSGSADRNSMQENFISRLSKRVASTVEKTVNKKGKLAPPPVMHSTDLRSAIRHNAVFNGSEAAKRYLTQRSTHGTTRTISQVDLSVRGFPVPLPPKKKRR
jgi:hypothetical protein